MTGADLDRVLGDDARVLRAYLAALDAGRPGWVEAVHVTGSAALGDYRPGVSDIDLVVVLAAAPGPAEIAALRAIHADRRDRPYLDATYLSPAQFAARPADAEVVPHATDGVFRDDAPAGQLNPVTWAELARHAVTLRGAAPPATVDDDALRAWCAANLHGYWARFVDEGRDATAGLDADTEVPIGLIGWTVLGPPRLLATIETGAIISKTSAGTFAIERFPAYAGLVRRCVAARHGEPATATVADVAAAADLVAETITAADRRWPPAAPRG